MMPVIPESSSITLTGPTQRSEMMQPAVAVKLTQICLQKADLGGQMIRDF